MCKVWRVPLATHCNLLPHFAFLKWFSKRCIKCIKMALNSDTIIVRTIINVGLNDTYSIMVGNWRHLRSKYCNGKM